MKIILPIIIFSILSANLSAQRNCDCAERLKELAGYYYALENFQEGLAAMKQVIAIKENTATEHDYVFLTYLYAENDSLDQVVNSILTAVEKGMSVDKLQSKKMLGIKEQLGDDRWEKIMYGVEEAHLKYKSNLDLDYRLAIEYLLGGDQIARAGMKLSYENLNHFDSLIFTRLVKLIDEKGFPDITKHGFDGSRLEAFMLHYSVDSDSNLQQVLGILGKANEEGIFNKEFIALVIDRYNMRNGFIPQVYGLWTLWQDREKGQFSAIANIESIDKTRFTHNLLRIKEQALAEGLKLPENYKATDYPDNYFCGFSHFPN